MCKAYCVVLHCFFIEQLSAEHIGVLSYFLEGLLIKTGSSFTMICLVAGYVPIICVDSGYAPPIYLNPECGPPVGVTPGYAPPICMEPRYTLPVPLLVNSASARILYRHGHYG